MAAQIRDALNARDMTAFRALVAEDARWGEADLPDGRACFNRNDIIKTYKKLLNEGVTGTVVETITGPLGVVCQIEIDWPADVPRRGSGGPVLYQIFTINDGLVTRIGGTDDREMAVAAIAA